MGTGTRPARPSRRVLHSLTELCYALLRLSSPVSGLLYATSKPASVEVEVEVDAGGHQF